MKPTPRNGILFGSDYPDVIAEVDTLYEIADAEFTSDNSIHNIWNNLATTHKEFRGLFARELRWKLEKISVREGFICSRHAIECVAQRIANDWWDEHELMKEYTPIEQTA